MVKRYPQFQKTLIWNNGQLNPYVLPREFEFEPYFKMPKTLAFWSSKLAATKELQHDTLFEGEKVLQAADFFWTKYAYSVIYNVNSIVLMQMIPYGVYCFQISKSPISQRQ